MSLDLRCRAELTPGQVAGLETTLANYYKNPPPEYYRIADESAGAYTAGERPFHFDLIQHVSAGMNVLELGCGTAHLCPYVEQRGGTYTGVDHSKELIATNRRRFPGAHFLRIGEPVPGPFDLVTSLYTIEHVVDPPAYLKRMWGYCRPGGLLAVICPEFVDNPDLPPSLYYGRTPQRLREKLRRLALVDALAHIVELKKSAPQWKRQAQAAAPGAFWLNLQPRVLHGANYTIDADAVHLVRRRDIVWFFQQMGAEIVRTSADMTGISPDILRFNGYVLARKPAG